MKPLFMIIVVVALLGPIGATTAFGAGQGVDSEDAQRTFAQLMLEAEAGNPETQHALAERFFFGYGTTKSYEDAALWFKKAADQGFSEAQYRMGNMYNEGWGVNQSEKEALRLWLLAAERGNPSAASNLSILYKWGSGREVPLDDITSYMWSLIAVANGNPYWQAGQAIAKDGMTRKQIEEAEKKANEWLKEHGQGEWRPD